MSKDRQLIKQLGGPAKLAKLLGYKKCGGIQRVYNWMSRGIPARVKLQHPEIFLMAAAISFTYQTTRQNLKNEPQKPEAA